MLLPRRGFLTGVLTSLITAPAIVRSGISRGILMPVRRIVPSLPSWLGLYAVPDCEGGELSPHCIGTVPIIDGDNMFAGMLRGVILPPGKCRLAVCDERGVAMPSSAAEVKYRTYDGFDWGVYQDSGPGRGQLPPWRDGSGEVDGEHVFADIVVKIRQ